MNDDIDKFLNNLRQSKKKLEPKNKQGAKVRRISDLRKVGIDLPEIKPKKLSPQELRKRVIRLISFAKFHNFIITPVGFQYYVDAFAEFNTCPCDRSRKDCPCSEAVQEVETQGKCLCQLFWKDYQTYLAEKYNI